MENAQADFPRTLRITHENTGMAEFPVTERYVEIDKPFVEGSSVTPEKVTLNLQTWKKPASQEGSQVKESPQTEPQYVLMGGISTSVADQYAIMSMLRNHAGTIVGIAHPDSPQSKIEPWDSPFNEEKSFANSGYAVLRAIEQLRKDGTLDPKRPITLIGHSAGATVGMEIVAQDCQEAKTRERQERWITNAVLLSPAGMLEMDSFEHIQGETAAVIGPYWNEFKDEVIRSCKEEIKRRLGLHKKYNVSGVPYGAENVSEKPAQESKEPEHGILYRMAKRYGENEDAIRQWNLEDPAWKAMMKKHIWIERGENMFRLLPTSFLQNAVAHFHRSWFDQRGWPHWLPETEAVKRSHENIAHDVTSSAREAIHDTNMLVILGEKDRTIPVNKFLSAEDTAAIEPTGNPDDKAEVFDDRVQAAVKKRFANNESNTQVLLMKGDRSHHLGPRSNASMLEHLILRKFYPDLLRTKSYPPGEIARLNSPKKT